jgi:hypothetical protein
MSEETTPSAEEIKKQEKQRILTLLLTKKDSMTADYRNIIKFTGGLLSQSMVYAYSKALNDVIKLLAKEQ